MRNLVSIVTISSLLVACQGNEQAAGPAATATGAPRPAVSAAPRAPAPAATPAPAPAASAAPAAQPSTEASAAPVAGEASATPTADEWTSAAEVRVTGSSALGCTTKRVREWVGVFCDKPNDSGGTPVKVTRKKFETLHKGGPTEQRKDVQLESGAGRSSLVARYVAGTDVEATFTWTDKEKLLVLFWPVEKPEPMYLGAFK